MSFPTLKGSVSQTFLVRNFLKSSKNVNDNTDVDFQYKFTEL